MFNKNIYKNAISYILNSRQPYMRLLQCIYRGANASDLNMIFYFMKNKKTLLLLNNVKNA